MIRMFFDNLLLDDTNRYLTIGGGSVSYDAAGNLTVDHNGYQYAYDYENRITEIKDSLNTVIAEYAYSDGQDNIGGCNGLYGPLANALIMARHSACAGARTALLACYGPSDPGWNGHLDAIDNHIGAIENCSKKISAGFKNSF